MIKTINKFSFVKIKWIHLILLTIVLGICFLMFQKIEQFEDIPGSKSHYEKIRVPLSNYISSINSVDELNKLLKMLFLGLNENLKSKKEVKMLEKTLVK